MEVPAGTSLESLLAGRGPADRLESSEDFNQPYGVPGAHSVSSAVGMIDEVHSKVARVVVG